MQLNTILSFKTIRRGVAFSLLSLLTVSHSLAASQKFIAIGTGGPTGVYFVVGNAICRVVNKQSLIDMKKNNGTPIKCSAPSTGGSVYNMNSIISQDFDLGIVQSDVQYEAFKGTGKFEGKPFTKLRALFSVHPEPFQILVSKNSNITSWADLKGKRVNIGNPGSGQRNTFETLMIANNVDASYFGQVTELTSTEQSKALCNGNIDAYGYTVGVPNAGVAQAADGCGAKIITLDTPVIKKLIADTPFYSEATIKKDVYSTIDADVKTFGVTATVVTSSDVSTETIYKVVRAVFENLEDFKKLHPSFAELSHEQMIKSGLSAPLHPGAIKYYKEKGWIK